MKLKKDKKPEPVADGSKPIRISEIAYNAAKIHVAKSLLDGGINVGLSEYVSNLIITDRNRLK